MVRALLAGTKTQTRRPLRAGTWFDQLHGVIRQAPAGLACTGFAPVSCPYGQPGDRLWVRETWAKTQPLGLPWPETMVVYAAGDNRTDYGGPWKPSIHMPRWASRITLEITGVRVERLQSISEADATAEGTPNSLHLPGGRFANENFAHLWEAINGPESWAANPWVWAITFNRVP